MTLIILTNTCQNILSFTVSMIVLFFIFGKDQTYISISRLKITQNVNQDILRILSDNLHSIQDKQVLSHSMKKDIALREQKACDV